MKKIEVFWSTYPLKDDFNFKGDYLDVLNTDEERRIFFSYKVPFKKIEFLYGRLLSKKIISNKLNVEPSAVFFKKSELGKPYLDHVESELLSNYNLNFNISHTENIVAIVISNDVQVGIDIETIKPINTTIISDSGVFSKAEIDYINFGKDLNKLKRFYKIWTLKEAFLKAKGTGFNDNPNSFSVPLKNKSKKEGWEFQTQWLSEKFLISTVAEITNESFFYTIKEVNLDII